MRASNQAQLHFLKQTQQQSQIKSRTQSGLRRQLSLPCLSHHINLKQLYPSKSWNQLARQTEEKKQKRKLNNQLKNQLEKFFDGDQILMEPSRGSKSKNNRLNKRMSTERNQSESKSKSSLHKKSSQSLGRQNKPFPKAEAKETNFVPRKGVKPTQFLADLDIEDSSSDAFKSLVPQSPNQPSFAQRSTPKQTPRSHVVPSRLNSNKNNDSAYRQQSINRYTQPDSPVDLLQPLRSQSSHHLHSQQDFYDRNDSKYPEYVYNSLKSAEQALLRSQDSAPNDSKSDTQRDATHDKLSYEKNVEMLKQIQRRLGCQNSQQSNEGQEQYYTINIDNVEYLNRPNQLEIIDQVEDERSFNVQKDSDDGRLRSIPLSVVEQKVESDLQQNKRSNNLRHARYSIDGDPVISQDSDTKMIRQCSSKELLKNQEAKQEQNKILPESPFILTQSFKKKEPNNVLQISHTSNLSKQEDQVTPTLNIFTASIHQKPHRYIPSQVFDMSPIQRSKASGIVHDHNDSSISKQFGNDWFTPKHDKKSQSIEKLSPIYDQVSNTEENKNKKQAKNIYKDQFGNDSFSNPKQLSKNNNANTFDSLQTFPTFQPIPSTTVNMNPLSNNSLNQLSIKYPQPSNLIDKNQHHTLKVIKKTEINKLIPSSIPQLNLNQYTYQKLMNQNNTIVNQSKKEAPTPINYAPLSTQPIIDYSNNKDSTREIKDDPVKQISRKFSIDFSQLNFSPRIDYSSLTPLNFTPTKIIQKSTTSYNPNAIPTQSHHSPLQIKNRSSNSFIITNSPLNSFRPSASSKIPPTTQRNSVSAKKGIRLWINNYQQNSSRSKSPLQQRLSSLKKKMSFERMRNLDKGIFQSKSKDRTSKKQHFSPKRNLYKQQNRNNQTASLMIDNSKNLGPASQSIYNHDPSRKQSLASPVKNIIRLGNRGSVPNIQSPQHNTKGQKTAQKSPFKKQGGTRSGIKLSCEFKKHKYQQKGIVKFLN